jgi:putative N-acetylmannosamine-6-phosphate epimerase
MKGKVKQEDMNERITTNLAMMDNLLELRKVEVSSLDATKSVDSRNTVSQLVSRKA